VKITKLLKLLNIYLQKSLIINLIIFVLFTIEVSYLSNKFPDKVYSYKRWIFKERKWEENGQVYHRILKVNYWKNRLPELGDFLKGVFPKKQIKEYSQKYLQIYLIESCKAELTHWGIILSSCLFLFWCDLKTSAIIVIIAVVLNLPYVAILRYNRPRIVKLIRSIKARQDYSMQS
jgi:glycosyl-4,4'-diaponeurosporenoate acyltransferase